MKDVGASILRLEIASSALADKARLALIRNDTTPEELSRIKRASLNVILKTYDLLDSMGIKTIGGKNDRI